MNGFWNQKPPDYISSYFEIIKCGSVVVASEINLFFRNLFLLQSILANLFFGLQFFLFWVLLSDWNFRNWKRDREITSVFFCFKFQKLKGKKKKVICIIALHVVKKNYKLVKFEKKNIWKHNAEGKKKEYSPTFGGEYSEMYKKCTTILGVHMRGITS